MKEEIVKVIDVQGMSCQHCVMRIENELKKIKNVKSVKADLEQSNVTVRLKKDVDEDIIKEKINDLGFETNKK